MRWFRGQSGYLHFGQSKGRPSGGKLRSNIQPKLKETLLTHSQKGGKIVLGGENCRPLIRGLKEFH